MGATSVTSICNMEVDHDIRIVNRDTPEGGQLRESTVELIGESNEIDFRAGFPNGLDWKFPWADNAKALQDHNIKVYWSDHCQFWIWQTRSEIYYAHNCCGPELTNIWDNKIKLDKQTFGDGVRVFIYKNHIRLNKDFEDEERDEEE